MTTKFTYYGGMCMSVETSGGFKILVDPFFHPEFCDKTRMDFSDIDLVLVTHAAYDHYGDTAEILAKSNAILMAGTEVIRKTEKEIGSLPANRQYATIYGDERYFGDVCVRTVVAHHCSNTKEEACVNVSSMPLGFIVQCRDGVTYYHPGDTSIFSDMRLIRELYKPNIMIVGISRIAEQYPCEMTPREAAMATMMVAPDVVVPSHYSPGSKSLDEFIKHIDSFAPYTKVKSTIGKPFLCSSFICEDIEK